jgi:hypothetical protein
MAKGQFTPEILRKVLRDINQKTMTVLCHVCLLLPPASRERRRRGLARRLVAVDLLEFGRGSVPGPTRYVPVGSCGLSVAQGQSCSLCTVSRVVHDALERARDHHLFDRYQRIGDRRITVRCAIAQFSKGTCEEFTSPFFP